MNSFTIDMKVEIHAADLHLLVSSSEIVLRAMEEEIVSLGHDPSGNKRYIDLGVAIECGKQSLRETSIDSNPT